MIDWSSNLNPAQFKAVTHRVGPLLVVAGPGTGKTRVLSYRIGHLIETGDAKPDHILAMTFTNQAAKEISERVSRLLNSELSTECVHNGQKIPKISTFHGWALGFLKQTLGEDARLPIDEKDARDLCQEAAKKLGLSNTKPQGLYERISKAKQHFPPRINKDEDLEALIHAYHGLLEKYGLWDYDDLLLEALRLLEHTEIRAKFLRDFTFILVDEFQDISPAQYTLIKSMARKDGNITVIGDPNQAIYGFRGSSPEFIHCFNADFEDVKTVLLDTVYRCPQVFLDAATSLIKDRSAVRLKSVKHKTPKIRIRPFGDPTAEAKWVARTIEQIVGGLSFVSLDSGTAGGNTLRSLSDVAVLFRAKTLGNPVAEALSRQGIPFQRADTPDPLAQKELRSIWRLWEVIKGRTVQYHLLKLPGGKDLWNKKLLDLKLELQGKDGPQLLSYIIDVLDLDPNRPLIRALARAIKKQPHVDSLAVLLRNEADMLDINIEAVSLLSIHAAKGLEFPVVFLIGCEPGILPWKEADPEEEKRLFYVGLTRASEKIYLSHVKHRRLFGQMMHGGPSPFIADIPEKLLIREKAQKPRVPRRPRQKKLF
ncbi:MAG: ATP-dependent helicase [Deltaproteobacteria bacterium]|nr:ATP-dependent helicase [Deltaproteobacteria bacterium]MBW1937894.1 ATP-dependent helicase [Deltaproteobacteria bacterium]MBW2080050.1 ATP-dependent helicase [Deltaproteobacteria bacterium]